MPRQIYRFEIDHEVARSGGNIIHAARDTMDGSTVQLYEWNPGDAERKAAPDAIAAARDLDRAEIFSDRSTYYLAIRPEDAKTTLDALRPQGLFSGPWPGLFDEPPPLPKVQPKAPVSPPPPPRKGISKFWIFGTLVSAAAAAILLFMMQVSVKDLNERVSQMQSEKESVQKDLDQTKSDLADQRKSFDSLQTSAAKEVDTIFDKAESLQSKDGTGYESVSINNCSSKDLRVVIRYKSPLGVWVTSGWYRVKAGAKMPWLAQDRLFYLFAADNGISWPSSYESMNVDVPVENFSHEDGEPLFGTGINKVAMTKIDSGSATIGCHN